MTAPQFDDPDFVAAYAEGVRRFVPAYDVMQLMAAQLIAEAAGEQASVLVLGAGGGLELRRFAELHPDWRFTAVDPSAEMLSRARAISPVEADIRWVEGVIEDAPPQAHDAATCLLTLHVIPDDGSKLRTLREIRARLKPGAPLLLVDHCVDRAASDYRLRLGRYAQFARSAGAEEETIGNVCQMVETLGTMVSSEREEALLREAGFDEVSLFYAALSWRGWRAA